uniref:Uncharacterized protein n=1 Tax=Xiphophorus couchianus TaxID=32473 RepID=A0A3B5L1F2_9TELE
CCVRSSTRCCCCRWRLWINMQDYAISKGLTHNQNQSRTRTGPDCCVSRCRLGQRVSEQRVPAGHRVQVLPGRAAEAQRPAGPRLRRGQVSRPLTFHPALLSSAAHSAFPAGTSHPSLWPKFTAASTRSGTACWPARTWTSSRPGLHPERGGSVPVLSQFTPSSLPVHSQFTPSSLRNRKFHLLRAATLLLFYFNLSYFYKFSYYFHL